jgi:tellurite methyltransferase
MSDRWTRFFAAAGSDPRATLLDALARFEAEGRDPGIAVDLGAGTGRDTAELVRRGWTVVAVDAHPEAIERIRALGSQVRTVLAPFDEVDLPAADLVNASFALPFCAPPAFERTWQHIVTALLPRGRFCGQLFGERDQWAPTPEMTFHSRAAVDALLDGFEVERLEEIEQDGQTAVGAPKHWHLFHVVARLA